MKNKFKRKLISWFSIVSLLVISSLTSVLADTITITNPTDSSVTVAGRTFNAYKVFSVEPVQGVDDSYIYTIEAGWVNFFKNSTRFDEIDDNAADFNEKVAQIIEGNKNNATWVEAFANEMYDYAKNQSIAYTEQKVAPLDATSVAFSDSLTAGYYLISDETNVNDLESGKVVSAVMLNNYTGLGDSTLTITLKADQPELEKVIIDNGEVEANTASVGEVVEYKITSAVPDMTGYVTYKYVMTDTLSSGLTLDTVTGLNITVGGKVLPSNYYTLNITTGGFTLTINDLVSVINDATDEADNNSFKVGAEIIVTYQATVNENAVTGNIGNSNSVKITYSNNPTDSSSTIDSSDEIVITYVSEIEITKKNAGGTLLSGAKFSLYSDEELNNKVASYVTGNSGIISFKGLDEGTYYIVEDSAPSGYNNLEGKFKVIVDYTEPTTIDDIESVTDECIWAYTISYIDKNSNETVLTSSMTEGVGLTGSTTGVAELTVINMAGGLFPETGGIGTVIFTVVGAFLMITALVLFTIKKKVNIK